jgi:hypothetical protein
VNPTEEANQSILSSDTVVIYENSSSLAGTPPKIQEKVEQAKKEGKPREMLDGKGSPAKRRLSRVSTPEALSESSS